MLLEEQLQSVLGFHLAGGDTAPFAAQFVESWPDFLGFEDRFQILIRNLHLQGHHSEMVIRSKL